MQNSEKSGLRREVGDYSLFVTLTRNCNILCRYCSCVPKVNGRGQIIDSSALSDLICWLAERRNGFQTLQLSGGEPFLHPDLFEFIKSSERLGYITRLQTNGTMIPSLTDTEFEMLKNVRIKVSIDGHTPAIHEIFRERGSHYKAVSGISTLVARSIPVGAKTVFTSHNIDQIPEFINFLNEIGVSGFTYNMVEYTGLARSLSGISVSESQVTNKLLRPLAKRRNWSLLNGSRLLRWIISGKPVIKDKLPWFVDYKGDVYRGQIFSNMVKCGNIYTDKWGSIFSEPTPGFEKIRLDPTLLAKILRTFAPYMTQLRTV